MTQDCCRLCCENGGALINIFSDQGISRKIGEKINLRLHILVLSDDFLPKTICFSCYGKLDIFDSFVKSVHSVQGQLIKQVSSISKNCAITPKPNVIDITEKEVILDESRSFKTSENRTAKKRVLEKDETSVIKKAKTNQINHQVARIALHINDTCSLPSSSSVNTCNRPLTRKNGSTSTETVHLQNETVDDSRKKLNNSFVSSHTENEPNEREKVIRNCTVKPMKITNPIRKSESGKNETPIRQKTKFKRKYFELKPKNQLTAKTPIKRLPPVTSKIKSLPSISNKVRSPRQFSAKNKKTEIITQRRILRSNIKNYYLRRSHKKCAKTCSCCNGNERVKIRSLKKNFPSAMKKDYSAQAGNTLYSDLKNLKNSLILKRVPVNSAEILAIFTKPDVTSKNFPNSRTDKGCQTDVRLLSRSKGKNAIIHQKIPVLDGKSPLDNYWEQIPTPFKI